MKRKTSTIPFGYELDETTGSLNPIADQLEGSKVGERMEGGDEISLQAGVDWLEYKTDRKISTPGLKKHIDKKYGKRHERLGEESSSLLTG